MGVSNLSESQQDALLAAVQVCATFSLMGSVFILACYTKFPHLRKLSFTLVFWLAVADIGADISYFMGNPADRATCVAQGALQQFFQVAQILWTVAIACVLHDVTVNLRMYHPHEQKSLMRRFHFAVWGVALLGMLLPFTTDNYGSTGSWCWIESSPTSEADVGTMWRYVVLYCPLWAAIVFNIMVYIRIVRIVRRFSMSIDGGAPGGSTVGPSAEQQTRMTKFVKRLVWYPAVLIVSWTFATINRIQNAVNPEHAIFGLFLLHTCLVACQGLMNAVVYGSTEAVRDAVVEDPCVKRCGKDRRSTGGAGAGAGSGGGGDTEVGLDPEDEGGSTGVGMRNIRYDEMMDDSLGGFGDAEKDDWTSKPGAGSGGASVSSSDVAARDVSGYGGGDEEDIVVYNASKQSVL